MGRGAWQTIVHVLAELDITGRLTHTHTLTYKDNIIACICIK